MTGAAPILRPVPVAHDAEALLLGIMLMRPAALDGVRASLRAEHFADDRHGLIWDAICAAHDAGTPATVPTLRDWADRHLADSGGVRYLAQLAGTVGPAVTAPAYARLIVDMADRRALSRALQDGLDRLSSSDPGTTAAQLASEAEAALRAITERGTGTGRIKLATAADQAITEAEAAHQGKTRALLTGINTIDDAMGGIYPQDLVILAARPGMGKTALALSIARNVAGRGQGVLVFSLEMSATALTRRLLAGEAGVSVHAMRRGQVGADGWVSLVRARPAMDLPIEIDDRAGLEPAEIRAAAMAARRRGNLALIVVDHIGKIRAPKDVSKHGPTAAVGFVSGEMKALAKDLDCPVIALCQLSRAVEARDDRRPQLGDLRQSGEIEQDADAVLMLYREAYYHRARTPKREPGETPDAYRARREQWDAELRDIERDAELALVKLRDGEPGTVRLGFDPRSITFGDPVE